MSWCHGCVTPIVFPSALHITAVCSGRSTAASGHSMIPMIMMHEMVHEMVEKAWIASALAASCQIA